MKKSRPIFDASFKLEIAKLVIEQGLSVMHVSQSMNVGPTAIRRGVTQHQAELVGSRELTSH